MAARLWSQFGRIGCVNIQRADAECWRPTGQTTVAWSEKMRSAAKGCAQAPALGGGDWFWPGSIQRDGHIKKAVWGNPNCGLSFVGGKHILNILLIKNH